jgi:hypothetical protein
MLKLEDIITVRHVELMCKVTLATGSIVGYAYAMEFFIAWYSGNPYETLFLHQPRADPFIIGPLFHIRRAVLVGLLDHGHLQRGCAAILLVQESPHQHVDGVRPFHPGQHRDVV